MEKQMSREIEVTDISEGKLCPFMAQIGMSFSKTSSLCIGDKCAFHQAFDYIMPVVDEETQQIKRDEAGQPETIQRRLAGCSPALTAQMVFRNSGTIDELNMITRTLAGQLSTIFTAKKASKQPGDLWTPGQIVAGK